ncbi:MAG: hypothetical protein K9N22_08410 [Candidatus Marinimicrobia bacterium]|nr:hypothetical protein [Candidatus Neomarinimicrobiota bacterium]MCF7902150.1 hypothetical protein [Candidatus Neomarinimicrobiota bacterium]
MDDRRTRFFWNLSILLGIVILVWQTFSIVSIRNERQDYELSMKRELGADTELDSVINFLEARLEDRAMFSFTARENPLDLSRGIYLTDNAADLYRFRQQNIPRVSAVVYGSKPMVVVQLQGQNMQLAVGDTVAGERIIDITTEGMVTLKNGVRNHYNIAPATLSPEEINRIRKEKRRANEETY